MYNFFNNLQFSLGNLFLCCVQLKFYVQLRYFTITMSYMLWRVTISMMASWRSLRQRRDFANKRQWRAAGHYFPKGRRAFSGRIHKSDAALRVRRFSLAPCPIIEARQGFACRIVFILFKSLCTALLEQYFEKLFKIICSKVIILLDTNK